MQNGSIEKTSLVEGGYHVPLMPMATDASTKMKWIRFCKPVLAPLVVDVCVYVCVRVHVCVRVLPVHSPHTQMHFCIFEN